MDEQTFAVLGNHARTIKQLETTVEQLMGMNVRLAMRVGDLESVLRRSAPHIETIEHRRDLWDAEYHVAIAEGESKRQPE